MNKTLPRFLCSLVFLAISIVLEPRLLHGQVNGNATISGWVFGEPLWLSTETGFAGAVTSLWWKNKQFVDNGLNHLDRGRQFQTAASFFNRYECYNPNEAGANFDAGPNSSSQLLWLTAGGNTLESQTLVAFWRTDEGLDAACGDRSLWQPAPPHNYQPSNYQVHKKITIGFAGIENAIEWLSDLWIPEQVTGGQVTPLVAFMPYEFAPLWSYDVVSKTYRPVRATGGEDDSVKVRMSDNEHALAYYSPERLQPYDGSGFWWTEGPLFGGYAAIGGLLRFPFFNGPGYLNYRSYLVIGNKDQVKTGLDSVHLQFRDLDPDVFNWKHYLAMNPDLAPYYTDQIGAQVHWLNNGINEGRIASRTFLASSYLQLNPDVAAAFGANNYAGAIYHYIAWGRNEGRGTVANPACGNSHSLVFTNRKVKAAGNNGAGQFGNGTSTSSSTPTLIANLENLPTEVAAGEYTSFAVKTDGTLWMWGSNASGARGNGTTGTNVFSPVQVVLPPVQQGGSPSRVATPLRGGKHGVGIGSSHYAAVDTEGWVWTWGQNWNGRLGDGTTTAHYIPARVKTSSTEYLTGIVSIAVGGSFMAALDADANVWTWGAGANGALGNASTADSPYAVKVVQPLQCVDHDSDPNTACQWQYPPLVGISQVACGSNFCIARARWGEVYAWGSNAYGQLGTPGGGYSTVAVKIPSLGSIRSIAAGSSHCLAVHQDGQVYAWGANFFGQLGTGNTTTQTSPVIMKSTYNAPGTMGRVDEVAAGTYFSLMIRNPDQFSSNRVIFGAGYNGWGQLGIPGNTTQQNTPVQSSF